MVTLLRVPGKCFGVIGFVGVDGFVELVHLLPKGIYQTKIALPTNGSYTTYSLDIDYPGLAIVHNLGSEHKAGHAFVPFLMSQDILEKKGRLHVAPMPLGNAGEGWGDEYDDSLKESAVMCWGGNGINDALGAFAALMNAPYSGGNDEIYERAAELLEDVGHNNQLIDINLTRWSPRVTRPLLTKDEPGDVVKIMEEVDLNRLYLTHILLNNYYFTKSKELAKKFPLTANLCREISKHKTRYSWKSGYDEAQMDLEAFLDNLAGWDEGGYVGDWSKIPLNETAKALSSLLHETKMQPYPGQPGKDDQQVVIKGTPHAIVYSTSAKDLEKIGIKDAKIALVDGEGKEHFILPASRLENEVYRIYNGDQVVDHNFETPKKKAKKKS